MEPGHASLPALLEGGVVRDDGAAVGAWFLDRHDLAGAMTGSRSDEATLCVGGRDGALPRAGQSRLPPDRPVRPSEVASVAPWRGMTRTPLMSLLSGLDGFRDLSGLLATDEGMCGGTADMVADLMGEVMPGVPRDEVLGHVAAEVGRLLDALAPFTSTLDPGASALLGRVCELGVLGDLGLDGLHAALDRTFDPAAPLARAWGWHPGLRGMSAEFLDRSPDAFRAAVAGGPDAYRDALRGWMVARPTIFPVLADMVLDVEAAAWPLDAEEEALLSEVVGGGHPDALVRLCSVLRHYPASWWPRDREALVDCACCLPAMRWCAARAPEGKAGRMLGAGAGWAATSRRLRRAHGRDGSNRTLQAVVDDLGDVSAAFAAQVIQAALLADGRRPAPMGAAEALAEEMLWSGRGVVAALETSRDWHARREAMLSALPMGEGTVSWPACLPDADHGDVSVRVLTDRAALVAEGVGSEDGDGQAGLSHCVGGYAPRCLDGTSRILSIRSRDGSRLSTAEVDLRLGRVRVLQHRGAANSAPPPAAEAALARYVGEVADGVLETDGRIPSSARPADLVEDVCGYDALAPGAWDAAWALWSPLLPRPVRSLAREGVVGLAVRDRGAAPSRDRWREGGIDLAGPA